MKTAQMVTSIDRAMALMRHHVDARIQDTIAVVALTQVYQNDFGHNIEAVYTFPLPFRAQLLDLEIRIGDIHRKGVVRLKSGAQDEYEQAINDADTAILLEQKQPGLFVLSLGNLMKGESAEIKIRYALALAWEEDILRLALPTTTAPRIGSSEGIGLTPDEQPPIDPLFEQRSTFEMEIVGSLANAGIYSPTHNISVTRDPERAMVKLVSGSLWMDRDLIVVFRKPGREVPLWRQGSDEGEYVVHAAMCVPASKGMAKVSRSLKIVIDCSSAMAGDAMTQARQGALRVLTMLKPTDKIGVVAFGSRARCYSGVMVPASGANISDIASWIDVLDADMGGTATEDALQLAFSLRGEFPTHDVLLISAGEVADPNSAITSARSSGHRLFIVGVGASPAESYIRRLSEATHGAAAFATPHEDTNATIKRLFRKIEQPRMLDVEIRWPCDPLWHTPYHPRSLFAGDTVHLFAEFSKAVHGPVQLQVKYDDGTASSCQINIPSSSVSPHGLTHPDIRRFAAGHRLLQLHMDGAPQVEMEKLAVSYQIMTPFTAYVAAVDRGDGAAVQIPQLKRVLSMAPAGGAGVGSVVISSHVQRAVPSRSAPSRPVKAPEPEASILDVPSRFDGQDLRLVRSSEAQPMNSESRKEAPEKQHKSPADLIAMVNSATADYFWGVPSLNSSDGNALSAYGVPVEVVAYLESLAGEGRPHRDVMLAFWLTLIESPVGDLFSSVLKEGFRNIESLGDDVQKMIAEMAPCFAAISAESWAWRTAEGRLAESDESSGTMSSQKPLTTVATFAGELQRPALTLLEQFREAGVPVTSIDSAITPYDKLALLKLLRRPRWPGDLG